jgi:hypothetical protein
MQYETFNQVITNLQKHHQKVLTAEKIAIDLADFEESLYLVITDLLTTIYGKDGAEWIEWFIYERHGEGGPLARDADGKPICYDAKSLWEYLEQSLH